MKGFPPFCGTLIDKLFTNEAMCANFVFWGKTSPPFLALCCLEGFCSSLYLFRVDRMMGAEGSDGKMSPPFLASIFQFFRGYFWFGPFERSKPLGVRFALIVPFVLKVFWFGPFERSKPLGVYFDKYAKFADFAYFANLQI